MLADIAERARVDGADTVFEIGPGPGALTHHLVDRVGRLILIEKDTRFAERLAAAHEGSDRVVVCEDDATRFAFPDWLEAGERAVAVGNLPYNVASPIYFHLLRHRACFARLVLMFQREVAERLVAGPGSKTYGAPSVATALLFHSRIVHHLPPSAFTPPPKVHSAVVQLEPRAEPLCPVVDEERFFRFVRSVFRFRRKTLANAMRAAGVVGGAADVAEATAAAGVDPGARAEQLDVRSLWRLHEACARR